MLNTQDILNAIGSVEEVNGLFTPHLWGMVSHPYIKTVFNLAENITVIFKYEKEELHLDLNSLDKITKVHEDGTEEVFQLAKASSDLLVSLPTNLPNLRAMLRSVPSSFGEYYETEFSLEVYPDKNACIFANIDKDEFTKYIGIVEVPIFVDELLSYGDSFDDAYAEIRIRHLKDLIVSKYVDTLTELCDLRLNDSTNMNEYLSSKSMLDSIGNLLEGQIFEELVYKRYKEEMEVQYDIGG